MSSTISGHAPPHAVTLVTVVGSSIATGFVATRMYARLWVAKNGGWDDVFIVISVLFSWATTGTMIEQVRTGLGRHVWALEPHESMLNLRAFWASIIVYNVALTFTKLSILLQYLRIFPQRTFRIWTYVLIGIVIAYAIWRFFSALFACYPIDAYWNHKIKDKTCLNRLAVSFASTSLNMATDLAIAALPLPMLNKLELPKRQRRALMGVFGLGGCTCIISILRLPSLYNVMHSKDVSWNNPMGAIWSSLECNTAIVCSCLPTLRCLFPRIFKMSSYGMSGDSSSTPRERKSAVSRFSLKNPKSIDLVRSGPSYLARTGRSHQRDPSKQSQVNITAGRNDSGIEDIGALENGDVELATLPSAGRIHVRTEINQRESRIMESPTESTKDLISQKFDAV